jgi:phosphatidylglycerophosphate synthase
MTTTAAATPFREAPRVLGLTGRIEKRALVWMAARVPAAVTPDHLTLLGLVATLACGVAYAFAGSQAWLLLVVNAGLVLNWLGDSLDGTLARHRRHERPRFGFYVDHLVDAFGALFLVGGLAVSGLMTPLVGAALLVAYFLLGIQTYLAAYTIGRFKISWGGLGGTELRLLLAALNVLVMFRPRVDLAGSSWLVFDALGATATAALLVVSVVAGVRGTLALAREEGWAKPDPGRSANAMDADDGARKGTPIAPASV